MAQAAAYGDLDKCGELGRRLRAADVTLSLATAPTAAGSDRGDMFWPTIGNNPDGSPGIHPGQVEHALACIFAAARNSSLFRADERDRG